MRYGTTQAGQERSSVNVPAIHPTLPKVPLWKAMAVAGGLVLGICDPLHAASGGGDTVQGLFAALLSTMKDRPDAGSKRSFHATGAGYSPQLCDIGSMTRLAVGPSWAGLTEAQRREVSESRSSTRSHCRQISARIVPCRRRGIWRPRRAFISITHRRSSLRI